MAVLSVLIFHALPERLRGGFIGVDIFFVISGFLITQVILTSLEHERFSVSDFYARRVRRIFPALFVVLAASLAFGWKTILAEDLAALAKHVVGGVAFISNLFYWQEADYFDKSSTLKPLLHLWSLGIEEQFYLVWPLLLWVGWRLQIPVVWLMAAAAALSFVVNVLGVNAHQTATFYSPVSRAWELLARAMLACRRRAGGAELLDSPKLRWMHSPGARTLGSFAGAGLMLLALAMLDPSRAFPGWWALLPCVGTCLVIWAGPQAWFNRVMLANPFAVGIGLISYPLYLWHWPVLTLLGPHISNLNGDTSRLPLLLVSGLLAWATYQFVEKPVRLGGRQYRSACVLVAVMLILGCVAAAIWHGGGAPWRYPKVIQNATHYDLAAYRTGLRDRKCFMEIGQSASDLATECVDPGDRPLWVLWGDSGAATLYPGLRALEAYSGEFRVGQFTSSSCPPLIDFGESENPACRANNELIFERIRALRPEVVLLSAIWGNYDHARIEETIAQLKAAGVARIYVLGPAPAWREPPSRIAFRLWKDDPLHRTPPARLSLSTYGFQDGNRRRPWDQRPLSVEAALQVSVQRTEAKYVSLMESMCNRDGCLTRESKDSGDSFYLDIVHLNRTGSEFVMNAVAGELGIAPRTR